MSMSELAALIEEQVGLYDELIALSRREQQALTRYRPAHLPELLAAEDNCADRLMRAQAAVDDALRSVAGQLGMTVEGGALPDIAELLPHLAPDIQARVAAARDSLEERAYTLAVLNAENASLVHAGLVQIDQAAAVLATALGEPRGYEAGGGVRISTDGNAQFLNLQA